MKRRWVGLSIAAAIASVSGPGPAAAAPAPGVIAPAAPAARPTVEVAAGPVHPGADVRVVIRNAPASFELRLARLDSKSSPTIALPLRGPPDKSGASFVMIPKSIAPGAYGLAVYSASDGRQLSDPAVKIEVAAPPVTVTVIVTVEVTLPCHQEIFDPPPDLVLGATSQAGARGPGVHLPFAARRDVAGGGRVWTFRGPMTFTVGRSTISDRGGVAISQAGSSPVSIAHSSCDTRITVRHSFTGAIILANDAAVISAGTRTLDLVGSWGATLADVELRPAPVTCTRPGPGCM